MDLGAIFFLILVLALILIYVTRPFFIRQRRRPVEKNQEHSSVLAEHERLLNSIQELDSDQTLKKIPVEDYSRLRAELLKKGADLLRQIDAMTPPPESGPDALLGSPSATPVALSDDELEELLAGRRTMRKERAGGFCSKCGQPVLISDAFCPACGHALK